ncbi:hypothetical protein ES703_106202 [subsurface metagenome]
MCPSQVTININSIKPSVFASDIYGAVRPDGWRTDERRIYVIAPQLHTVGIKRIYVTIFGGYMHSVVSANGDTSRHRPIQFELPFYTAGLRSIILAQTNPVKIPAKRLPLRYYHRVRRIRVNRKETAFDTDNIRVRDTGDN